MRDYYGLDDIRAHELLNDDINRYRRTMTRAPNGDAAFIDRYALEVFFKRGACCRLNGRH